MDKGKAYAFFSCSTSKEEIQEGIEKERGHCKISEELEVILEETKNLKGDSDLMETAKKPEIRKMNYVIEASYPGKGNIDAANQLAIMMITYYNIRIFKEELHSKTIRYKRGGKYITRN